MKTDSNSFHQLAWIVLVLYDHIIFSIHSHPCAHCWPLGSFFKYFSAWIPGCHILILLPRATPFQSKLAPSPPPPLKTEILQSQTPGPLAPPLLFLVNLTYFLARWPPLTKSFNVL